jgi:hypothetical protein
MIYEIFFEIVNKEGNIVNDTILISGDTIEEIREKAKRELKKRNGINAYSIKL